MINLGKVQPGSTIYIPFETFAGSTGAPITLTGLATSDIQVYKDGGMTQRASASGFTLLDTDGIDIDGITGIHGFSIDLSDNTTADFWASGSRYIVVVSTVTVDSQTMSFIAATFSIGEVGAILDTTIATLSSQTSFTLTNGPADNNALIGCAVIVHDAASAVQIAFGIVSAYTGSTKTVTLLANPSIFTMAAKDNISFFAPQGVAFVGTGGINSNTFASGAITATALAAAVITSTKFGSGAIDAAAIASDAITAAKIADGAIDAATFASGAINAAAIASDAITAAKIADGAIDAATFAAGAINAAAIAADAIGASELAADAVAEIQSGLATSSALSTLTNIFTGITSMAQWLGLIAGKQTGNSTARTEIRATGAGSGTFDETTDSVEAIRDRGDAAWTTGGGGSGPTAVEIRQEIDANSTKLDVAVSTRLASASYTAPDNATIGTTAGAVTLIKAKTDNLPASPAATGDAMTLTSGERSSVVAALFAAISEGTETFIQTIRLIRSSVLGKLSGAATSTVKTRDAADSKDRITATVDADGNRSAVTTDGT